MDIQLHDLVFLLMTPKAIGAKCVIHFIGTRWKTPGSQVTLTMTFGWWSITVLCAGGGQ